MKLSLDVSIAPTIVASAGEVIEAISRAPAGARPAEAPPTVIPRSVSSAANRAAADAAASAARPAGSNPSSDRQRAQGPDVVAVALPRHPGRKSTSS
ncbi:MAG: hypothetical protein KatS3mg010_0338 [Acidimicrobiia bacterium]|nr:MAG: hypothetical protein KatS3mg010_0338 [Acidimicrobiia bacterium]